MFKNSCEILCGGVHFIWYDCHCVSFEEDGVIYRRQEGFQIYKGQDFKLDKRKGTGKNTNLGMKLWIHDAFWKKSAAEDEKDIKV